MPPTSLSWTKIDGGAARMNYENVPRELAKALHMNYVFGVEFIELNGIYLRQRKLGARQPAAEDSQNFGEDPSRDLGMEGSAMLSRYPIRDATVIRSPPICTTLAFDSAKSFLPGPLLREHRENGRSAPLTMTASQVARCDCRAREFDYKGTTLRNV